MFNFTKIKTYLERSKSWIAFGFMMLSSWFLFNGVARYLEWPPDVYSHPDFFNITEKKIPWEVYTFEPNECQTLDCLTRAGVAISAKRTAPLPIEEFPLKNWTYPQHILYRAEITLPADLLKGRQLIVFHNLYVHAKRYWVHVDGILLDSGERSQMMNVMIPLGILKHPNRFLLEVKVEPPRSSVVGISHYDTLGFADKELVKPLETVLEERITTYFLWFLLPKVAYLLMFAFLYAVYLRNDKYFELISFIFFSAVATYFASDFPRRLIPGELDWYRISEITDLIAQVFFVRFIASYFDVRRYVRPAAIITALLIFPGSLLFYHSTDLWNYNYVAMLMSLLKVSGVAMGIFYSLKIRNASGDGSTYSLVYSTLLGFFIFSLFPVGLELCNAVAYLFELPPLTEGIPIASFYELVFMWVLSAVTSMELGRTYSAKEHYKRELTIVEERLELGRSVQSLLLPQEMQGELPHGRYHCYYEAAQKMSGDWLQTWNDDRFDAFLLGDVVGKGPQAALAVSAIMTTISDAKTSGLELEQCIERIHDSLKRLFHGKITTTLSAMKITKNGAITLFNCGAVGWMTLKGTDFQLLPIRSKSLGASGELVIGRKECSVEPGEMLFSFSDGCLEGSRGLKQLSRHLKAMSEPIGDADKLHDLIITLGEDHALEDDKTMVIFIAS